MNTKPKLTTKKKRDGWRSGDYDGRENIEPYIVDALLDDIDARINKKKTYVEILELIRNNPAITHEKSFRTGICETTCLRCKLGELLSTNYHEAVNE